MIETHQLDRTHFRPGEIDMHEYRNADNSVDTRLLVNADVMSELSTQLDLPTDQYYLLIDLETVEDVVRNAELRTYDSTQFKLITSMTLCP